MKWHFATIIPVLLAASITSCKKDNSLTNNATAGKPSVAFQLRATNPSSFVNRTAARTVGISILWTSAKASVSLLKFEAENLGAEVEFKSNVQQTIDLFDSTNSLGNVSIPAGTYSKVEFKLQLSPNGNNPALELKGQFNDGTTTTNIIFRATEMIEVKGEKANVTINDSILHKAITSMDLAAINKGITASALSNAVKTNGDVLISPNVNVDLYDIIVRNLRDLGEEEDFD